MSITVGWRNLADVFSDEYLYGSWTENKYHQYLFNKAFIPLYGTYAEMKMAQRESKEYLNRYGLDYTDIHNPERLSETSATTRAYSAGLNFVSSNITKLYHSDIRTTRGKWTSYYNKKYGRSWRI